jgi:rhodanese-related sulfurtransferase
MKPCVVLAALGAASCGTNQFEAEAALERKAVPLARETVVGGYALVTAEELSQRLVERKDLLLVDAMPAADFAREHIQGARNFEFPREAMSSWDSARTGGKSEADFAALLGEDRERIVVVYCGFVACTRSHNAALWAAQLGFRNVVRFPGGIQAWKGIGRPVVKE